ncbi:MAG: O-antigen ligase family protein, partial [Thermoanaerobaculia bacterium]|nr:O-antigen ligase family protein [Thermoanaerobaculia bacterium]
VGAVLAGGGVQAAHGLRGLNLEGRPRLSGTFFNPDHCALYLEICVTLAAAVTWWFLRNRRRLSMDATVVGAAVGGGLWLGFLFALGLTGSRAALVAAGAGCAVQGVLVLVWSRGGRKHLGLAAAALALASGALVAASHYGPVLARLAVFDLSDSNIALRWAIWRDSLTLLGSFPLTGTGLGTFLEAFALVQSPATVGVRWVRAHNDLVELLVTAGAVGAVAVALTLVGVGRRLYRLAAAGDTEGRAAVLALAGVLAAVAVHEMADFGASLPGNWVALVVVTGALLGSPSAGGLRRVRDGRRRSARAGGSRRESGEPG